MMAAAIMTQSQLCQAHASLISLRFSGTTTMVLVPTVQPAVSILDLIAYRGLGLGPVIMITVTIIIIITIINMCSSNKDRIRSRSGFWNMGAHAVTMHTPPSGPTVVAASGRA
jgi:hypothetical protein